MEFVSDPKQFDDYQLRFVEIIAHDVRLCLKEFEFSPERLFEATGNVAFSVCGIIDGSRLIEIEGRPLRPILGFALDQETTQIVAEKEGTYLHEYAFGAVEALFENTDVDFAPKDRLVPYFDVVLKDVGPNRLAVISKIHEVLSGPLSQIKQMADSGAIEVHKQLSWELAREAAEEYQRMGATIELRLAKGCQPCLPST